MSKDKVLILKPKYKSTQKIFQEYYCELTSKMNEFLQDGWKDNLKSGYGGGSYAMYSGEREDGIVGEIYALRFPGATRGHFQTTSDGTIDEIEFYEEQSYGKKIGCYIKKMESLKKKFMGYKVIVEEAEK